MKKYIGRCSTDELSTETGYSEHFNPSCGKLSFSNAHMNANELTNRACQHVLNASVSKPDPNYEPFSYAAGTGSRYASSQSSAS